jgi:CBS domain-containing protein
VLIPDGERGVANYGRVMTTTASSPLAAIVDPGAPPLITARDVVRATLAGATSAEEVIAPEAPSVAPGDTLLTAAELMVHAGEEQIEVRDQGEDRARGVLSSWKSCPVG